jgi:tripartite-type tricarboxylate transporter receptor subunit TctC
VRDTRYDVRPSRTKFHQIPKILLAAAGLASALGLVSNVSHGQPAHLPDYPTRMVRVLSLVPAGGLSDIALRPLTQSLAQQFGVPVIVENRPGAGGMVEGRICARAAPDGYTVCNVDNEVVSNPDFLFKDVGYDTQKDFAPITNGYYIVSGFVVTGPMMKVHSLNELIALSKSTPGGINIGSPATSTGIFIQAFNKEVGANFHVIPYKSGAEVTNGLLTNSVQVAELGLGNMMSYLQSGAMRALSVDSAERLPQLPDAPTLRELGYEAFRVKPWYGFVAPAGTPKDIIQFLHDSIIHVYSQPDIRQRVLINAALEPIFDTPEEFGKFLAVDYKRTGEQVNLVGLKPQ